MIHWHLQYFKLLLPRWLNAVNCAVYSSQWVTLPATPEEMFMYDLKYADGSVERNAKAEWVEFDQRPNLQPEVRQRLGCCRVVRTRTPSLSCPDTCRVGAVFPCCGFSSLCIRDICLQDGLYDKDFLHAPKTTFGAAMVQDFINKIQERRFEPNAADHISKLVSPDVPGRQPGQVGTFRVKSVALAWCQPADHSK